MRPGALTKLVVLACFPVFLATLAFPQESQGSGEIQSILRAAGALVPAIDEVQQSSVAANIANAQTRTGDLEGALSTVRAVKNPGGQVSAMGLVASALAWRGSTALALDLIRNSAPGDDQHKAYAYLFVAQQLASRKSFDDALRVARLIGDGPAFFGRASLFVDVLMQIHAKQWAAGDLSGAKQTLNMALDAVERERENPSAPEFAESMPAGMYSSIATGLANEGNRDAAMAVVDRIFGLLPIAEMAGRSNGVLSVLAMIQANLGDLQGAATSAERLAPQARDVVIMIVAIKRAKEGDVLGATDGVMDLSSEPLRNTSLRVVADGLAASGGYSQALSTIDKIQGAGERAYGLAELALEQAEKVDPAAAMTVDLAWEAALNARSETKPFAFAMIAVTRGILGDFPGALEIIATLAGEERVWPLQNLTALLVHAGKKAEAMSLAESQEMPYARSCALLGIANQLIDEEREAAKKIANEATS